MRIAFRSLHLPFSITTLSAGIDVGYSILPPKLFFAYEDVALMRQHVHWATYDADERTYKDRGRIVSMEFGSAFTVAPIDDGPTMDLAFAGELVSDVL